MTSTTNQPGQPKKPIFNYGNSTHWHYLNNNTLLAGICEPLKNPTVRNAILLPDHYNHYYSYFTDDYQDGKLSPMVCIVGNNKQRRILSGFYDHDCDSFIYCPSPNYPDKINSIEPRHMEIGDRRDFHDCCVSANNFTEQTAERYYEENHRGEIAYRIGADRAEIGQDLQELSDDIKQRNDFNKDQTRQKEIYRADIKRRIKAIKNQRKEIDNTIDDYNFTESEIKSYY